MSIRVMARVWDRSVQAEGTLLVLLAIADYATDEGVAYPSISSLMHRARLSERAVRYALRALESAGELHVELQAGPHRCNLYRVLLAAHEGADIAPSSPSRRGQFATPKGAICDTKGATGVAQIAPNPSTPVNKTRQGSVARARARANHQENIAETTRKWPRGWDPADPTNWDPADRNSQP
jgi:hypothetical protein